MYLCPHCQNDLAGAPELCHPWSAVEEIAGLCPHCGRLFSDPVIYYGVRRNAAIWRCYRDSSADALEYALYAELRRLGAKPAIRA